MASKKSTPLLPLQFRARSTIWWEERCFTSRYWPRRHRVWVEGFCRLILVQHKKSSLQQVLSTLLSSASITASFPSLAKLAAILIVLSVTTATVEWTFSRMNFIKTQFHSRMEENTLEHTMQICMHWRPRSITEWNSRSSHRSLQTFKTGKNYALNIHLFTQEF